MAEDGVIDDLLSDEDEEPITAQEVLHTGILYQYQT